MFWRFGFHNGSAIDSLLDKEDVSLEAILDEDDLLQECKSQNTRLIDYFQRVDVLQRLFGYVTGQIESEEKGRFKYPYVATEVLCSEIWSIVETCVNEQDHLLVPFWETVLDRSAEDMKTQMVMASHFAKINSVFLGKKPAEMLAFIKAQPLVVEKLVRHIETPSFVDLLIRIIQLDEHPEGAGALEWLSSENFIGRLIDLLAPHQPPDIHTIVAELIKNIITMATPSPGAGITDGLQNGPASNRFARELAQRDSVLKLMSYILFDFSPGHNVISEDDEANPTHDLTDDIENPSSNRLPTLESATSSVVQSISIIIELIRKNNSDYFEPYLFHSLRNRLIQIQQHLQTHTEDGREALEHAMQDMVDRMGVVHFGPLLEIMCEKLDDLQRLLRSPRSINGPVSTTIGVITPLTLERYRICELFAELLHCSNMSLLNRPPEYNFLYDAEGRLQGGLSALEGLAQVISLNHMERDRETTETVQDEVEPALELPVSGASRTSPVFSSDDDMSDDDEPGSSDEDAMEEIAMFDEPTSQLDLSPLSTHEQLPQIQTDSIAPNSFTSSPSEGMLQFSRTSPQSQDSPSIQQRSHGSRRSSRRTVTLDSPFDVRLYTGERLKRRFMELNILSTFLDLFFEFPWNNFLHSAVYDLIHQILTGNVVGGLNRELAITLFRDARLMQRILDGQKRNDTESAKPKGVRLGYMGHLTLISEDVIVALERYPTDLKQVLVKYVPSPEWDEYVSGRFNETKRRDTSLLGGGKPVVAVNNGRTFSRWQVDEDEPESFSSAPQSSGTIAENGMHGELKRAGLHPPRASTADFGPPTPIPAHGDEDDGGGARKFATYLAQEMHSSEGFGSSSSDEEDEEGGWLSHSNFSLGNPPVSARHMNTERRPLSSGGFADSFDPLGTDTQPTTAGPSEDSFNADDEEFGPFSDANAASGEDPFTFSSSFSDDMDDGTFDSFGDFGEFHHHVGVGPGGEGEGEGEGEFGELTPTTGSWTFASDISEERDSPGSDEVPLTTTTTTTAAATMTTTMTTSASPREQRMGLEWQ
ncbi:hypothetical protein AX17_006769 [Amanita inopinata Kibby_2008]|nr:hypothetical protein AX17_006769 [Amanita inopinata Kibby_2008]